MGEWNFDTMANEFEFCELVEWGFRESELIGAAFEDPELMEHEKSIHAFEMFHVLVSVPVHCAADLKEIIKMAEKLPLCEVVYGAN